MGSNTPSTPNINVAIKIERIDEYQIQEISYDGQEKSIPPLSMSENLSRLISKIDFNQPIDELREELENSSSPGTSESKQVAISAPSWPFDNMRTKLRIALTEICVLNDVLSIAKEKKYMIFDAVQSQPLDQRPIVALMAKKKALQMASQMLLDGAASLRNVTNSRSGDGISSTGDVWMQTESFNSSATNSQAEPSFYNELREMRKTWRLKKVGNAIVGDLSYFRPVGVRFTPSTRFEVIKTSPGARGPKNQALAVRLPTDLEGKAYIQVSIIKDDKVLVDLSTSANGRYYENLQEKSWQEKLESAQNVLFCKELFCHLANQAVQYQFVIPTTVTANQIILALFPDIKLYITLIHHTPNTKCSRQPNDAMKALQGEHKPVLEHSLHQMLKDFYANMFRRMQGQDMPRDAGPSALDKQTIFEMTRQESSLDKIVQQAQHLVMRHQTMDIIDSFVSKFKDPLIISHWFCLNSPTNSIIRVDIVSPNNEILGRSHMLIQIGTRQLRVHTRDCKNLLLGYEPDELRQLLMWQLCLHQFIAADKLSKLLGWYTLILNPAVNVTRQEVTSTACSLVICPSNCTHMISVKLGPQFGVSVDVAQFKDPSIVSNGIGFSNPASDVGSNRHHDPSIESILSTAMNGSGQDNHLNKLQDLVENSREVDWDKMHGKDFLSKLELLMAALTDTKR